MKKGIIVFTLIGLSLIAFILTSWIWEEETIDFNTQVRPILNAHCLNCHGGVKQQSGLSFLFEEEAFAPAKSGHPAIVPGAPNKSELIKRIEHPDPEIRMPPEGSPLSDKDKKILRKWIRQGAEWDTHWAYEFPEEPVTPPGVNSNWIKNEIDQFVWNKLANEDLSPNSEADKSTLIRRVSLDLTGLPPQPEEVVAFVNDNSPEAYEKVVDRLLASPHFGERWASMWLDMARYADSRGYQKDRLRPSVWRYRDWVIHAFNQDMPFDQFTIEQLAGDLLQDPDDNQLLATVFHRNTMTNDEGGTDDEEFRVAAVIDRVNTTMEVWQATTISCVQCHAHPYDPIRHEEFYELYAFFNNTADHDRSDDAPRATLFSPGQKLKRANLEKDLQSYRESGDTLTEAYQELLEEFLAIQPASVPVMQEFSEDTSRITHVFERGNWLVHGEEVKPDVPGFLPPMPEEYPDNRLGFAQWLVDKNNPLTARVIVNRFWEQLFGEGLIRTMEDFGTQSDPPVYPRLLDWLAHEFSYEHEWSIKSLLKQIVMSATYRQSSAVSDEILEKDPYNELLARGPRFRLSAEQIRDQALVISGLLNPEVYGPSVMPYQPEGVWNVIRHTARWETSEDGDQHRRALYTFWRRVSPYPSMMTFDTPSRELCSSKRIRTNTPLQALVTLNDPVFVEAANAFADRMLMEGGASLEEQIAYGFQLALMREPDAGRLQELVELYEKAFGKYKGRPDTERTEEEVERLAMVNVANVILNLSEVLTRT